jgi:recombination protein RecT
MTKQQEEKKQNKWEIILSTAEIEFTEIASIDGNIVNFQREVGFVVQIISNRPEDYRNVSPDSVRNAVINIARIGVSLNPVLKLAYLVPSKGECRLDISYIGLLKIATDTGSILCGKAEIVYANDGFIYNGPFEQPTYPDNFNPFAPIEKRGAVIGCYTIVKLHNGSCIVDIMNNEDLAKIRSMSKAKSGPWFDWEGEMIKKCGIKRASKMWPRTERLGAAESILNQSQGNEIDITPTVAVLPNRSRQNAAQIAEATQIVKPSKEGDKLIAQLEAIARESGAEAFMQTWKAMAQDKRALVGKNNRDRIHAMGVTNV